MRLVSEPYPYPLHFEHSYFKLLTKHCLHTACIPEEPLRCTMRRLGHVSFTGDGVWQYRDGLYGDGPVSIRAVSKPTLYHSITPRTRSTALHFIKGMHSWYSKCWLRQDLYGPCFLTFSFSKCTQPLPL